MWRDDASLLDMLTYARRAAMYTQAIGQAAFERDALVEDATIRCLIVIGEAAGRVSSSFREAHDEIPWSSIIGTRNRLTHEYARIDLGDVWTAATRDCALLIDQLERLVPAEPPGLPDEWEFL